MTFTISRRPTTQVWDWRQPDQGSDRGPDVTVTSGSQHLMVRCAVRASEPIGSTPEPSLDRRTSYSPKEGLGQDAQDRQDGQKPRPASPSSCKSCSSCQNSELAAHFTPHRVQSPNDAGLRPEVAAPWLRLRPSRNGYLRFAAPDGSAMGYSYRSRFQGRPEVPKRKVRRYDCHRGKDASEQYRWRGANLTIRPSEKAET